jgi:hypothetical protein
LAQHAAALLAQRAERRAFATTAELGLDALPKPGRAAC